MLDVRLFRNPRFSAASAAIALAFFGLFGFIFMITQYFQIVRGYDPLGAGLATLPFAFVTAGFSPVAMLVMSRVGTKLVVAAGLAADERRVRRRGDHRGGHAVLGPGRHRHGADGGGPRR